MNAQSDPHNSVSINIAMRLAFDESLADEAPNLAVMR
jgi:hypothetical protein